MAGKGPFRRLLGGGSDKMETPQQVIDKVNDLDKKVTAIDEYISKTVEPTLNVHDDNIAGLRQGVSSNDASTRQTTVKVDAVASALDDKVNSSVTQHLNDQFKGAADTWFGQTDISAKTDQWLANKDMNPMLTKHMGLSTGLIPVDVGEILGVLDRVGQRISAVPELNLVADSVKITVPPGAGGVGTPTSGIPSSLHTVTAIQTIEDRLTKLTSTWYPMIVSLQSGWGEMFLPAASSVHAWGQRWSDSSDYILGNKSRFNDLLSGNSSLFDGRIGTIVDNKIAAFKAQINVTGALNADALGFLGTMTLGHSSLGGAKPKDKILDTIKFYYSNFGSGTLKDSIRGSVMDLSDEWQASDTGVNRIRGHVQDFWSSAGITGGLEGGSIKDRIDDWFGLDDVSKRLQDKVHGFLDTLPAWQKLQGAQDRLQDLVPHGDALAGLKDRLGGMRECVKTVRANMMSHITDTMTDISDLKDTKLKYDNLLAMIGWSALFGLPGAVYAGTDTMKQYGNHTDRMFSRISVILEKQNEMFKRLHDDLNCLMDQFDSASKLIEEKLKPA